MSDLVEPVEPREPPSPALVAVLVENHRRFLGFLEKRVGSREAAEDILQEAFVRGLERGAQLEDAQSATAWFYRLLRNAVVDHWRRKGAERRAVDWAARLAEGESAAPDHELMEQVCGCAADLAATLKPEYAEAIRRVDLGGASVKDFAAAAGISANNASVRLFRARAALLGRVKASCGTCADHGCADCSCGSPQPRTGRA
jgi:RNA polymerase sigma factor (sigma-70 family)